MICTNTCAYAVLLDPSGGGGGGTRADLTEARGYARVELDDGPSLDEDPLLEGADSENDGGELGARVEMKEMPMSCRWK